MTRHSILLNIMRLANPQHTLTPVLDWLYVIIGPGGLLLVDSDLYCPRFIFVGGAWNQ